MRHALRMSWLLMMVLALGACGDSGLGPDPEDAEFDASLGVDLAAMTKLTSGVYIQTLTAGGGTAAITATTPRVTVAYVGWLADGTEFDDGTLTNYPLGGLVTGFIEGVVGMKVGEKRKIVIPASLGYGPEDNGPIPGNSVLVFDVTLISIP
jgi:FKBP-type peptidyl-prolyl cis-trans isomerase FkpA